MKKAKDKSGGKSGNPPLVVSISIDAQGTVTVDPECLVVTAPKQRIRWKLDPDSARDWRLVGLCWCGSAEPPAGEFHDWVTEKARITVTDRNSEPGEWRYGVLYRAKADPKSAPPRLYDPMIRNQPA